MAVAPALAAGNTVVIKPSEVTPASVIEAARLAEAELRLDAMTAVHKRVVTRLGQLERRVRLARTAAPG